MKKIIITGLCILFAVTVYSQESFYEVLRHIEQNNASLAARRNLSVAETAEAFTGNSLSDPEIEYIHAWGKPSSNGTTGELTVKQEFDFPTAYAQRSRIARLRRDQFGYEYAAYRQQLMYEAYALCLEIVALRRDRVVLKRLLDDTEFARRIFAERLDAGSSGILDVNRAGYEFIAAKNAYDMAGIELTEAENRLTNLNGGNPVEFPDTGFPAVPDALPPLDVTVARYLDLSPDMLAAMAELAASRQELKLSRSGSLPKLAVGYRHEFSRDEKFNGIVVGMSVPLFANRNNIKRAKAQQAWVESTIEAKRVDLISELSTLYSRAELLRESYFQYGQLLSGDNTALLLGRALEERQITITDYFAQLQPLYEIEMTMTDILKEYILAVARINMLDL